MAATTFPEDFSWSAATSAYQVEGGITGNDWYAWERRPNSNCAEPAGVACDHHNRAAIREHTAAPVGTTLAMADWRQRRQPLVAATAPLLDDLDRHATR